MAVRLQHMINNLEKCCRVWNLKVTLKVLVFRIAGKLSKSDKLYGGDRVEIVNKYQGVIFTTNLSWDLYLKKRKVSQICCKFCVVYCLLPINKERLNRVAA